ncbi:hypothetical protein ES705_35187 [subsurface metagenome]
MRLTLETNLSRATRIAGNPVKVVTIAQIIPIPSTIPISLMPCVTEIARAKNAAAVVKAPVMIPVPERTNVCSIAWTASLSIARRSLYTEMM